MEIEENQEGFDYLDQIQKIEQLFLQKDSGKWSQKEIILDEEQTEHSIQYNLNNPLYQASEKNNFSQTIKDFAQFLKKESSKQNLSINLLSMEEFFEECQLEEKKGFHKVMLNQENNLSKILTKSEFAFLHFLIVFIRFKKLENLSLYCKNSLINFVPKTRWIIFSKFHQNQIDFDLFYHRKSTTNQSDLNFFFSQTQIFPDEEQGNIIEFFFQKKYSWKEELSCFKISQVNFNSQIFQIIENLQEVENLLSKSPKKITKKFVIMANEKHVQMESLNKMKNFIQQAQEENFAKREKLFQEFLINMNNQFQKFSYN